jgi:hypothetical protein
MSPCPLPAWALAALSLAACAADPPSAASLSPMRVLVKLTQPSTDPQAIARHASEVAGTPVSYVAATSAQWHALAVDCRGESACDQALSRLRADTFTYEHVSLDAKRRVDSR